MRAALFGFLVVASSKLPPRHVELALLDSLDEIGLALADPPAEPRVVLVPAV
jgi:hypothetical protein